MTALAFDHNRKPIGGFKNLLTKIGHGVSAYQANFSVAMAWKSGHRANPADLKVAGFTRDLEDRVLASTKIRYAE